MKKCSKCQKEQSTTEFYKRKEASDGLESNCKTCIKKRVNAYQLKNPDKIRERKKKWQEKNKTKEAERKKKWRQQNREEASRRDRQYYQANKKSIIAQHMDYHHRKQKSDPNYRIMRSLRSRLYSAMKGRFKHSHTRTLIGCDTKQLKKHIEDGFQKGMTWDNYGVQGWHIDHIKPLSSFDLSNKQEQQRAMHYTNLQPLWAKDNLKKSNKII